MNNEQTFVSADTAEITVADILTDVVATTEKADTAETAETTDAIETTLVGETEAPLGNLIQNADASRFLSSAKYMGIGMLGIFLVMGILIIGTALLNKIMNRKPKDGE